MICNDKKIAVLLGTYNGEKFLADQLNSLIDQTFQDFKIYVHDDGSKDETCRIINTYKEKCSDKINVIKGSSTGSPKGNFMFLMKSVESEYYMFCDQDDVWYKNKIELSYKTIQNKTGDDINMPCCTFTDLCVTDSDVNVISDSFYKFIGRNPKNTDYINLLKKNVFVGCTMLFNKGLRDEAIKVMDIDNIPMHDFWVGIIASLKGKVYFIDEATINYRQHENNNMGASKPQYSLTKKISNINKIIKIKKNKTVEQRRIAKELVNLLEENNDKFIFFKNLSEISYKSKITRLLFYYKYNLLKDGNVLLNIVVI